MRAQFQYSKLRNLGILIVTNFRFWIEIECIVLYRLPPSFSILKQFLDKTALHKIFFFWFLILVLLKLVFALWLFIFWSLFSWKKMADYVPNWWKNRSHWIQLIKIGTSLSQFLLDLQLVIGINISLDTFYKKNSYDFVKSWSN